MVNDSQQNTTAIAGNQESKQWLYKKMTDAGFNVGKDYDEFNTVLVNQDSRDWLYDKAQSIGLNVGDKTKFNELMGYGEQKPAKKSYWQSIGANDPYAIITQANLKEQEQEQERETAYQTVGMTDEDIASNKRKKDLEQNLYPSANIDSDGIINFKPQQYSLGVDGKIAAYDNLVEKELKTLKDIGVNKEAEQELEEIKANQPSYLTRGEETIDDIYQNALERSLQTPEGKYLYNQVTNKYVDEFKQSDDYKKAIAQIKQGKLKDEDVSKMFENKYGNTIINEYWGQMNVENSVITPYINEAMDRLQKKSAKGQLEELEGKLELEDAESESRVRESFKAKYGAYPEDFKPKNIVERSDAQEYLRFIKEKEERRDKEYVQTGAYGSGYMKDMRPEKTAAKGFVDDARKVLDAAEQGKGFFSGFGENIADKDTWDFGINQLTRSSELKQAIDKFDKGEKLTEDEELLLEAATNFMAVSAYYSDNIGRGYKAGQTTAVSLPFMLQFAVSAGAMGAIDGGVQAGVKGSAKAVVRGLEKFAAKKMGVRAAVSKGSKVLENGFVNTVGKITSGLISSSINAGLMTSTFGMPKVIEGTISRETGDIKPTIGEDGKTIVYGGIELGSKQSKEEAIKNSVLDQFIENWSEMGLAKVAEPIGVAVQGSRLFSKLGKRAWVSGLMDIANTPWLKTLRKTTQFQGLFGEIMEEEVGGLARWATMSDVNSAEEAGLDLDSQIDIVLGLAPTSLAFGGFGAVSHYGSLAFNSAKFRKNLKSDAERQMFDSMMEESRSGAFGEQAHDFIRNVLMNSKYTQDEKKAIFEGTIEKYKQVISDELAAQQESLRDTRYERLLNDMVTERQHKDGNIYETRDKEGRALNIVDGKVSFAVSKDAEGNPIMTVDLDNSDKKVKVRYVDKQNGVSKEFSISTADLTNAVGIAKVDKYKAWALEQHKASIAGADTFAVDGYVYNTESGALLGKQTELQEETDAEVKEEVEAKEEDNVEEGSVVRVTNERIPVTIDGKTENVVYSCSDMVLNADGSVDLDRSSHIVMRKDNGQTVKGKERTAYLDALSAALRDKKASEEQSAVAQEAAAEAAQQANQEQVVPEQELTPEELLEQDKQKVLQSLPKDKEGNVLIEKMTPEQDFVNIMETEGADAAVAAAEEQVRFDLSQMKDIEANEKMSPRDKRGKTKKFADDIAGYQAAAAKYAWVDLSAKMQENTENQQENLDNQNNNSNFAQQQGDNSDDTGRVQEQDTGGSGENVASGQRGQSIHGGTTGTLHGEGLGNIGNGEGRGLLDVHVTDHLEEQNAKIDAALEKAGIKATRQKVARVTAQAFHDAIAEGKVQNENGWCVDVHDVADYENDICLLTEDGKAGIAITPDGDIISLFSCSEEKGMLNKLIPMAIAMGGRKADFYMTNKRNGLQNMYARFGGQVVSQTPFGEEYMQDNPEWKAYEGRLVQDKLEQGMSEEEARAAAHAEAIDHPVGACIFPATAEEAIDFKENNPTLTVDIASVPEYTSENGYDDMIAARDKALEGQAEDTTPATPVEDNTPVEEAPEESTPEGSIDPIDLTNDDIVIVRSKRATWAIARRTIEGDEIVFRDVVTGKRLKVGKVSESGKSWHEPAVGKQIVYYKQGDKYVPLIALSIADKESFDNKTKFIPATNYTGQTPFNVPLTELYKQEEDGTYSRIKISGKEKKEGHTVGLLKEYPTLNALMDMPVYINTDTGETINLGKFLSYGFKKNNGKKHSPISQLYQKIDDYYRVGQDNADEADRLKQVAREHISEAIDVFNALMTDKKTEQQFRENIEDAGMGYLWMLDIYPEGKVTVDKLNKDNIEAQNLSNPIVQMMAIAEEAQSKGMIDAGTIDIELQRGANLWGGLPLNKTTRKQKKATATEEKTEEPTPATEETKTPTEEATQEEKPKADYSIYETKIAQLERRKKELTTKDQELRGQKDMGALLMRGKINGELRDIDTQLERAKKQLRDAMLYDGYVSSQSNDMDDMPEFMAAHQNLIERAAQSEAQREVTKILLDKLNEIKGITVHRATQADVERVMAQIKAGVEFQGENKPSWKETLSAIAATSHAISNTGTHGNQSNSESSAKVQQISDITKSLNELSQNLLGSEAYSPKELIAQIALALGIKDATSNRSNYRTLTLGDGTIVTIRISNHQGNAVNFTIKGKGGQSINVGFVIKDSKTAFRDNSKTNYAEFVYYGDKTTDAARQKAIVDGIRQFIETGSFEGIAVADRVNYSGKFKQQIEAQIAYHGSGAAFDHFDHSFMGTGEGVQAYGWGTYVSKQQGVGESYARQDAKSATILYNGADVTEWIDQSIELSYIRPIVFSILKNANLSTIGSSNHNEAFLNNIVAVINNYKEKIANNEVAMGFRDTYDMQLVVDWLENNLDGMSVTTPTSQLYTVDIPNDNGSNYLSWNDPVSAEEAKRIGDALYNYLLQNDTEGLYTDKAAQQTLRKEIDGLFSSQDTRNGSLVYGDIQDYLGSDKAASLFLNSIGYTGVKVPINNTQGAVASSENDWNYVIFNEDDLQIKDRVELMQTPNGTIYGWSIGNEIWLTDEGMNPETPIHEYTHLWAKMMQQSDKRAWKQIVKLCKKNKELWDSVANDANYANIKGNDDMIASEVLSRYSGSRGADRLVEEMETLLAEGKAVDANMYVNRIQKALQALWDWVCDTLGINHFRSLKEVADKSLYDLLSGTEVLLNSENSSNFAPMKGTSIQDVTLDNVEQLANDVSNGRLLFERFSPQEQRGFTKGGRKHVIASLLSGRNDSSSPAYQERDDFKRERQLGAAQEQRIEEWSKQDGCWYDNADQQLQEQYGKPIAEGGEAVVYPNPSKGTVVKSIRLDYYVSPQLALDRITLHNTLFPETALEVLGFGRDNDGNFCIIAEQPFVQGERMTDKEIQEYVEKLGFTLVDPRSWTYTNGDIYLSDLHDENVLRDKDGNVIVIDADVRLNDKDNEQLRRYGATREVNQEAGLVPAEQSNLTKEERSIIEQAQADGTYMKAPNGKQSNLTSKQWAQVRTQAFLDWFGDWENDPQNASRVLDENGEPKVMYRGSQNANSYVFHSRYENAGYWFTDDKRVAEHYARRNADHELSAEEFEERVQPCFLNVRNSESVDAGGRSWENVYEEPKFAIYDDEGRMQEFDTRAEAEQYCADNGLNPEVEIEESNGVSGDIAESRIANGLDGMEFQNMIDGSVKDQTDIPSNIWVVRDNTQAKSATDNIGTFDASNEDIRFQIEPTTPREERANPLWTDMAAAERLKVAANKFDATLLNPLATRSMELNALSKLVATSLDRTEGILQMQNSIRDFRKKNGLPPMGEGFDVRTQVEACSSRIANQIDHFRSHEVNALKKSIRTFKDRIEGSRFYEKYKDENTRERKKNELTPVEILERYLIACDMLEREQLGIPVRGAADFTVRMGVDPVTFRDEFLNTFANDAEGVKQLNELWNNVRAVTNLSIDKGYKEGLISEEAYARYKERLYYVPERDFAEVESNPDLRTDEEFIHRGSRTKMLATMYKARGGETLAANVFANMYYQATDAIRKSEMNKAKVSMFNLLRENAGWCRANNIPVPHQIWFMKDEHGEIVRMSDEPTAEQRKEMARLKGEIANIENELNVYQEELNAINEAMETATGAKLSELWGRKREAEAIIRDLNEDIEATREMFPYLDEVDTRTAIYNDKELHNDEIVVTYIDGVACEMMFPDSKEVAMALNGKYNEKGRVDVIRKCTSWISALFTVYNPTFAAVNIVRDVPFIVTKGGAEYGLTFQARFAKNLVDPRVFGEAARCVTGKDSKDTEMGRYMQEFIDNGANTGYSILESIDKVRKSVSKLNGKHSITWADVGKTLSFTNEWSEVYTRFAAYAALRQMGKTAEEATRGAKNLSVNFNRHGLGNKFMNIFNSISMFANAAIQGACGFYRAFYGNKGNTKGNVAQVGRAMANFMLAPVVCGFATTMIDLASGDDDEYYERQSWERDNYLILGDNIRIPLNEQLAPFFVIGVNIALGIKGKRSHKEVAQSIISSFVKNLIPLPPSLTAAVGNMITGTTPFNIARIASDALTPQVLSNIENVANNESFTGANLRMDLGDIPEYTMAENEAALYRDIAKLFYAIGKGNPDLPSKTLDDGSKMSRFWDVNPKQVKTIMGYIPSGITDLMKTSYALGKYMFTDSEKLELKPQDIAIVKRFYSPKNYEMYRYSTVKKAKEYVKDFDEQKRNTENMYKGAQVTGNKARAEAAAERYYDIKNNKYYSELDNLIDSYQNSDVALRAKKMGISNEALIKYTNLNEEQIEADRDENYRKILTSVLELQKEGIIPRD